MLLLSLCVCVYTSVCRLYILYKCTDLCVWECSCLCVWQFTDTVVALQHVYLFVSVCGLWNTLTDLLTYTLWYKSFSSQYTKAQLFQYPGLHGLVGSPMKPELYCCSCLQARCPLECRVNSAKALKQFSCQYVWISTLKANPIFNMSTEAGDDPSH